MGHVILLQRPAIARRPTSRDGGAAEGASEEQQRLRGVTRPTVTSSAPAEHASERSAAAVPAKARVAVHAPHAAAGGAAPAANHGSKCTFRAPRAAAPRGGSSGRRGRRAGPRGRSAAVVAVRAIRPGRVDARCGSRTEEPARTRGTQRNESNGESRAAPRAGARRHGRLAAAARRPRRERTTGPDRPRPRISTISPASSSAPQCAASLTDGDAWERPVHAGIRLGRGAHGGRPTRKRQRPGIPGFGGSVPERPGSTRWPGRSASGSAGCRLHEEQPLIQRKSRACVVGFQLHHSATTPRRGNPRCRGDRAPGWRPRPDGGRGDSSRASFPTRGSVRSSRAWLAATGSGGAPRRDRLRAPNTRTGRGAGTRVAPASAHRRDRSGSRRVQVMRAIDVVIESRRRPTSSTKRARLRDVSRRASGRSRCWRAMSAGDGAARAASPPMDSSFPRNVVV